MCSEWRWFLLLLGAVLRGQELPSPAEALALAFPGAKVERTTAALDEAMRKKAAALAGEVSAVVFPYVATKDGKLVGTAYFDTHRVRAQKETLMVVVAPDGTIARVEVVGFAEPREYLPKRLFYEQFVGRKLDAKQPLEKGLRSVAGATLTSQVTIDASKRVLAVHAVLLEADAKKQEGKDKDAKEGEGKAKESPGTGR